MGCATTLISKRLNITLKVSTIAEFKYNGVEKAVGYVGSNPTIYTNGSYIYTKSCVIQVLVRKIKTNYGDSYHKELEETDRILLARRIHSHRTLGRNSPVCAF